MIVVGITGGIASGKSQVANFFEEFGAGVIRADELGHIALQQPDVIAKLVAHWGDSIVDDQGRVIRAKVADRVFQNTNPSTAGEERRFLESVTHPVIHQLAQQQLADFRSQKCPAAVVDAALLFEAGWDQFCDVIVFVDSPLELRQSRASGRGWDPTELQRREATQIPLTLKQEKSNFTITNGGSLDQLRNHAAQTWQQILASASASREGPTS